MSRPWADIPPRLLLVPQPACGGGASDSSEQPASASSPAGGPTPDADAAVQALADSISKNRKVKPVVAIPEGGTPKALTVKDIVPGTGKPAKKGDTVTVQYVGSSWSTGSEFDSSWDRGQPFP